MSDAGPGGAAASLHAAGRRFVDETVLPQVEAWDRDDALLLALARPALKPG